MVSLRGKGRSRGGGFLRDVPRIAERAVSALIIFLIRLYKHGVSPLLPSSCRFHPSCSEYAILALQKHGLLRGLGLSAWRLLRCGPWSEGGYDPVPEPHKKSLAAPKFVFNQQRGTNNEEPT
ncbi:MAG: membrane protein insertion efficiency factor YidD [candidate division WOR-3 bacterium]